MAVLLTIGATAAMAENGPETNPRAIETFKKEFANAELAKWSVEDGYNKVSFILGGNRAIALFNSDGELLGSVRDLMYNQLPLTVMSSIDKRYSGAAIFDIREVINTDGTHYKLTVEQKGKKYDVSVFPDGGVSNVVRKK